MCLGILRLGKTHGEARLNAACERALALSSLSYRSVSEMLKHRLENMPLPVTMSSPDARDATRANKDPQPSAPNEHVRGGSYFDKEEPT